MINPALAAFSPQDNPDRLFFTLAFAATYGAGGGVGDNLNLTPFQSSGNPTGFSDPKGIYGQPLTAVPDIPPGIFSENLGGGYIQVYNGASIGAFTVRAFAANGTELAQGAAYPAAFLNGSAVIEVLLPLRTAS